MKDTKFTFHPASHRSLDPTKYSENLGKYLLSHEAHSYMPRILHRIINENLVARLRAAPFQSVFCNLACRDVVDPLKSSERRCRHSQVHFLRMPAKSEFLAPQLNSTPSSDENHGAHHQVAREDIRRLRREGCQGYESVILNFSFQRRAV